MLGTVVAWILGIATLIGGFAAIGYFRDKWREKNTWIEKEKEVNSAWWESSTLKTEYEAQGFSNFGWSNSEKVAERIASGKEVVYEKDVKNRVKYKLVNKSGQILLCKKSA